MSTYPSAKLDRHGTPRDCPAADWTRKRLASYTALQRALAASLARADVAVECTEDLEAAARHHPVQKRRHRA